MAQVNIAHFTVISEEESLKLTTLARNLAAKEVHGLEESEVEPDSVTVMVVPIDQKTSLSGADSELQILVSGNDWPLNTNGQPANALEAKTHFDQMAARIQSSLSQESARKIYVWITPFVASGWAE